MFIIIGTILEAQMEFYLSEKKEKEFEQVFQQVKQFYYEYSNILPESNKRQYYIGLYLLFLVSNNRMTDYCFELEFLKLEDFDNKEIALAVDIEHCISEGNYNTLYTKNNDVKDKYYQYFLNKLSSTIRFQIAKSVESSYESIKLDVLLNLLIINREEIGNFINEYKNQSTDNNDEDQIDWVVENNNNCVFKKVVKDKNKIPSHFIMKKTVDLAVELEKII